MTFKILLYEFWVYSTVVKMLIYFTSFSLRLLSRPPLPPLFQQRWSQPERWDQNPLWNHSDPMFTFRVDDVSPGFSWLRKKKAYPANTWRHWDPTHTASPGHPSIINLGHIEITFSFLLFGVFKTWLYQIQILKKWRWAPNFPCCLTPPTCCFCVFSVLVGDNNCTLLESVRADLMRKST